MKTIARIFSNKPCTMVVGSSAVKALKTNRIVCLDLEVNQNYKIEFFIEKEGVIEKTLMLSLTPDSVCTAYIVSVDWSNENISCLKDNTDPTHRHLKMDENNKPHCFIYDAKTFSLCHGIDAPYEYCGDFNEFGLAKVRYNAGCKGSSDYKFGVIDKNCRIIIPLEYESLRIYDGYIFASQKERNNENYIDYIYVLSLEGNVLFKRKASFASSNYKKSGELYNPKDRDGLIPIYDYEEGFCYINIDNEIVLKPKYCGERFDDQLFICRYDNRFHCGVVDIEGNIIISFNYEDIHPIKMPKSNKYVYIVGAKRNKYFIVVDSNEQQVINGSFERVEFRDDIICLLRENEWYFYDRNFKFITKYKQEDIRLWQWIGVNVNGRWLPFDKVVNY